jgi:hypothetical protein
MIVFAVKFASMGRRFGLSLRVSFDSVTEMDRNGTPVPAGSETHRSPSAQNRYRQRG